MDEEEIDLFIKRLEKVLEKSKSVDLIVQGRNIIVYPIESISKSIQSN